MRKKMICILISLFILTILFPVQGNIDNNVQNNSKMNCVIPQNKCAYSEFGDDIDNRCYSSTINLMSVNSIFLNFYTQFIINDRDGMYVHIQVDNDGWNELEVLNGNQTVWLEKSYDLSELSGHSIRVRFRYHTGFNSTSEGAYLDRISIIGDNSIIYKEDFEDYDINENWNEWKIIEKIGPNNPPYKPSNPIPTNGSTLLSVNTDLSWIGGDPDPEDNVTYDVYFGTDSNPPNVEMDIEETNYILNKLEYNTQYFWRIDAWDSYDNSTKGDIWTFTTAKNAPPYTPSNPIPSNGSTFIDLNADLSWIGGDPDGDDVLYNIYFGNTSNPLLISANQTDTTYELNTLENDTQYFWRIDAWDSYNNSTTGPNWTFRTEIPGNDPPRKPDRPSGPTNGRIQTSYSYESSTTDPNLDLIYYMFDWDDGTSTGWIGPFDSGQSVTVSHLWTSVGSYSVKVKAKDTKGYESTWSEPLPIFMPKNKQYQIIINIKSIIENYPILKQILQEILM